MTYFSTEAEATEYSRDMREHEEMCKKLYDKYILEDLGLRPKVTIRPEVKDYLFVTVCPPA